MPGPLESLKSIGQRFLETKDPSTEPLAPAITSEPESWWGGFGKGLYDEFVRPMTSPAGIAGLLAMGGEAKPRLQSAYGKLTQTGESSALKDLYGEAPTTTRREFFDRMTGRPEKRADIRIDEIERLSDEALDKVGDYHPTNNPYGWRDARDVENAATTVERTGEVPRQRNVDAKYGDPDFPTRGYIKKYSPQEKAWNAEQDRLINLNENRHDIRSELPDNTPGTVSRIFDLLKRFGIDDKGSVGAPELAMDEASRLARAKKQGYTKPMYHATHAPDFNEFDLSKADLGIHVTPNRPTANRSIYDPEEVLRANPYGMIFGVADPTKDPRISMASGSRIMPLRVRTQKILESPDIGMWKSPNHWASNLRDPQLSNQAGFSPDINPATKTNDPAIMKLLYEEAKAEMDRRGPAGSRQWNNFSPDESARFQGNMRDILQKGGYDTVKYPNFAEGKGEPSYMLTDPRQAKSKWAAYDPKKFGKTKDIMAGLAAALGTGGYLGLENEP